MRLDSLEIKNFRKLKDCKIKFRDTTFLIGSNNAGKSSVFKALDLLHKSTNVSQDDYSRHYNEERDDYIRSDEIEIIGEYHNLPDEANNWLGFKGRVITNNNPLPGETRNKIVFRKVWKLESSKPEVYLKEHVKTRSEKYSNAQIPTDLIGDDYTLEFISEHFGDDNLAAPLSNKSNKEKLNELPHVWDVNINSEISWVKNPGESQATYYQNCQK